MYVRPKLNFHIIYASTITTSKWLNIAITILDIIYRPVFCLKHELSETGFRLTLSEDRECLYLLGPTEVVPPEDGDRIQSSKRQVLNKRQDDG
jgi:hypothetical protein